MRAPTRRLDRLRLGLGCLPDNGVRVPDAVVQIAAGFGVETWQGRHDLPGSDSKSRQTQKEDQKMAEFLMTSAAARVAGVAKETIIYWEKTGKLPAIKTSNGRRLFLRADVERVAKERGTLKKGVGR